MTGNPRNAVVCDTPYLQNEFGDSRFFYVFNLILSFSTCSQSFKKICAWELLGANVLKIKKYELYLKILSKLDEPFARAFISTALQITAPFNNIRTLKFKPQQTNAFFATANQIFGGSSQPPTTAERAVLKSLSTVQTTKQYLAVASRKLRGASNI